MDKEEYRVRLESIKKLAGDGDFKTAAEVADTIDWKRVKNVRTLCMIAEIYEANKKYEDTNRILQYAYWRAHVSKTVLYRLTEVNIRTGHFDEARKYCDEFELLSPRDSTRHILRYKLLSAQDAPLSDQIKVLEAYRDSEFTERWAYELAVLYHKNKEDDKCTAICDDMVLWFGSGKYVTKALELKAEIAPLTEEQARKLKKSAEGDDGYEERTEYGFASSADERISAMKSAEIEEAFRTGDSDIQNRLADGIRAVFAGIRPEEKRNAEESASGDAFVMPEEEASAEEDAGILADAGLAGQSYDAGKVRELEPEVIGRTTVMPYEEDDRKRAESQITIDEYINESKTEETEQFEELISETRANLATAVASGRFEKVGSGKDAGALEAKGAAQRTDLPLKTPDFEGEEAKAAEEEKAKAAESAAAAERPAPAEVSDGKTGEAAEDASGEEAEMDPLTRLFGKETDESLGLTRPFNLSEEVAKALAESDKKQLSASEEALRRRAVEQTLRSAGVILPEDADKADAKETAAEESTSAEAEKPAEEGAETQETEAGSAVRAEEAPADDISGDPLLETIAEGPEELKRMPLEPRPFDEVEQKIFTYFTRVPGMSEQITIALSDVHNNAGDKTSRAGNIMIIGRQGAGKTRLSDALMVSICRDLGIQAAKSAKIIASDLNEKNVAEVVSKMRGGFLVIEGAGELSDKSVNDLLLAMEFRTDDLVVMLEDEKADLKALLLHHPEIEDKFTSTIVIPVFTNDELVAFARIYAKERGYRMDEMGILALYTMIGDNQSATEPVTVGKVKDMVDAAIEKADSGARRLGRRFSKKAVDSEGRILLKEKDFDY